MRSSLQTTRLVRSGIINCKTSSARHIFGAQRTYAASSITCAQIPVFSQTPAISRIVPQPAQNVAKRWRSAPTGPAFKVYEFDEIKALSEKPEDDRLLIDVREPAEYDAGYISTAINIPVKSQPDALFLPEDEFEDRFGFTKPELEKEVVFYCRSGVRSGAAAQLARQQGYERVAEYRGSWLDWQKHGGAEEKP